MCVCDRPWNSPLQHTPELSLLADSTAVRVSELQPLVSSGQFSLETPRTGVTGRRLNT